MLAEASYRVYNKIPTITGSAWSQYTSRIGGYYGAHVKRDLDKIVLDDGDMKELDDIDDVITGSNDKSFIIIDSDKLADTKSSDDSSTESSDDSSEDNAHHTKTSIEDLIIFTNGDDIPAKIIPIEKKKKKLSLVPSLYKSLNIYGNYDLPMTIDNFLI